MSLEWWWVCFPGAAEEQEPENLDEPDESDEPNEPDDFRRVSVICTLDMKVT